jgi:hypothetical protein
MQLKKQKNNLKHHNLVVKKSYLKLKRVIGLLLLFCFCNNLPTGAVGSS